MRGKVSRFFVKIVSFYSMVVAFPASHEAISHAFGWPVQIKATLKLNQFMEVGFITAELRWLARCVPKMGFITRFLRPPLIEHFCFVLMCMKIIIKLIKTSPPFNSFFNRATITKHGSRGNKQTNSLPKNENYSYKNTRRRPCIDMTLI